MSKFALECPKCGSINTASTFIFAKKTIQCGTCGEEINVKQSRLIAKVCPECGKSVVCDQAKMKDLKCPSCGENLGMDSATAKYSMKVIDCPQCYCRIEIDATKEPAECPLCGKVIDVKRELAKKNLISDTGISVIKYEGDNETFVWKHPIEDFNYGSQLIVHESQEAVFFLNGQALDSFGPGIHTLETDSLPVLKKIYHLPAGKSEMFHAEVYFVNLAVQLGLKWGTNSRIRFLEPRTHIPLDIGASGEMSVQVTEPRKLLFKLVGTTGGLSRQSLLHLHEKELSGYFRPLVVTAVKSNLAAAIKQHDINILEIDEKLDFLSEILRAKVAEGFEEYGLTVPQFYITNISLPENDPNFEKIRQLMAASYLGVQEAEVKANIAAAERKIVLEQQETMLEKSRYEAEKKRIEAQAEADKKRLEGFAEADVMSAMGYSKKDVLQAEVQKEYARGIGNMGGSGGSGGLMSEVLGMGVGMAAAGTVGAQVQEMMKGLSVPAHTEKAASDNSDTWTCSCGYSKNVGKYCAECGKEKPEKWTCPHCGTSSNTGKFCMECGKPKAEKWVCSRCGAVNVSGKFCSECGSERER